MTRIHDCPAFQNPGTGPGDYMTAYYSDRDFRQTDVLGINLCSGLGSIALSHKLPDVEETRSLAPQIHVSYAVVNPNSENKEEAIAAIQEKADLIYLGTGEYRSGDTAGFPDAAFLYLLPPVLLMLLVCGILYARGSFRQRNRRAVGLCMCIAAVLCLAAGVWKITDIIRNAPLSQGNTTSVPDTEVILGIRRPDALAGEQ